METIIKYSDKLGDEVSENELGKLDYYSKTFFTDNKIIKEETYIDGRLVDTTYPVISDDEIHAKLAHEPNASFDFTYHQNGYRIVEMRCYDNKVLIENMVNVYNENDELIGYRKYIFENGSLTPSLTEKYYYEKNEQKYEFEYDKNGDCFIIYDMQNDQSDIYASKIGNPKYTNFTWVGFEYYKNIEPIVPE